MSWVLALLTLLPTAAVLTSMTECTALTQPPPDSSNHVIDDILLLNQDFWTDDTIPQFKSNRLNSYEDLSSPESHLSSHRSRVSSGKFKPRFPSSVIFNVPQARMISEKT